MKFNLKLACLVLGLLAGFAPPAWAAVDFDVVKSGGADHVTMNDPAGTIVTYTITPKAGSENIVKLAFKLPNVNVSSGSFTWDGASALPAGWAVTKGIGTGEITVEGPGFGPGLSRSFSLILDAIPTWTADSTDLLSRVRGSATAKAKKDKKNLPLFTRHALRILSMVASPSAVAPGAGFSLVITVKNETSALLNSIVANPFNRTIVGTVTFSPANPPAVPNPLSLAAGAQGTITYNYTTNAGNSGTVTFQARVRHPSGGGASATSWDVTDPGGNGFTFSNTVSVSGFTGTISVEPSLPTICVYSGATVTVTMRLKNNTGSPINNVTPTLTPGGTATKILVSGPTPGTPQSVPANGGIVDFLWTYTITGALNTTYSFTGTAVGSSTAVVAPSPVGRVGGYSIALKSTTTGANNTNAGSTNGELEWSFTNNGCDEVKQVAITVPGGWGPVIDGYSIVNGSVDTWGLAGTTFSNVASPSIIVGNTGRFILFFNSTPPSIGISTFTVRITDLTNAFQDINTPIDIFAFGTSGLNSTGSWNWREVFQ